MKRNKMSKEEFKALWGDGVRLPVPGDQNEHTRATKKGHIHKVNPAARPAYGMSTKAQERRRKMLQAAGVV